MEAILDYQNRRISGILNLHAWCSDAFYQVSVPNALVKYKELKGNMHEGCKKFVCLFDSILYVRSTIFQLNRDGSSWVGPVLS